MTVDGFKMQTVCGGCKTSGALTCVKDLTTRFAWRIWLEDWLEKDLHAGKICWTDFQNSLLDSGEGKA